MREEKQRNTQKKISSKQGVPCLEPPPPPNKQTNKNQKTTTTTKNNLWEIGTKNVETLKKISLLLSDLKVVW